MAVTLGQAVHAMRKISRLTQPEFAKHQGIIVQALRQIESETANSTVETLNKVTVVTRNKSDFVDTGVKLLNPWLGAAS